jgi:hypothetical protein
LAELVQQQLLQPLEHPGVGPLGNRRQQVVTLPQPNSPTGSSAHGVEVRAMKMIAAMQARSGTVRGAPPRAREGGGGSSGWMRCHSWSVAAVGQGDHERGSSQTKRARAVGPCGATTP